MYLLILNIVLSSFFFNSKNLHAITKENAAFKKSDYFHVMYFYEASARENLLCSMRTTQIQISNDISSLESMFA